MSDPRNEVYLLRPDRRARVRAILDAAFASMERHFGCQQCRVSAPRWCADRNHVYCANRSHDNV